MALLMPWLFVEDGNALTRAPSQWHTGLARVFSGADAAPVDHDYSVKAGMGRILVLIMVGVEHALLLLLLAGELFFSKQPRWMQLVLERRAYEEKNARRLARAKTEAGQLLTIAPTASGVEPASCEDKKTQ